MFDISKLRHDYHHHKLCLIENIIPKEHCEKIVAKTKNIISNKKQVIDIKFSGLGNENVLDGGGIYQHKILDGNICQNNLPELMTFYHSIVPLVSLITDEEVIVSPYDKSAINIKVYLPKGDRQGWHYDTNAITALLYLTDNTEGATTCEIKYTHPSLSQPKIVTKKIIPKAGTLLLMQGREVWHCAEPMNNEIKISVPLNYYTTNDTWRPQGIDDLVYGNLQAAS